MNKKSFADQINPAMQFISQREGTQAPVAGNVDADEVVPEGYKMDPRYVQTKSRRLSLLMQPSLYEKVKGMAQTQGLSVNEFIHLALEALVKGE